MKFLVMDYEVEEYKKAVNESKEVDKWINEAVEELESAKKNPQKDNIEFVTQFNPTKFDGKENNK